MLVIVQCAGTLYCFEVLNLVQDDGNDGVVWAGCDKRKPLFCGVSRGSSGTQKKSDALHESLGWISLVQVQFRVALK